MRQLVQSMLTLALAACFFVGVGAWRTGWSLEADWRWVWDTGVLGALWAWEHSRPVVIAGLVLLGLLIAGPGIIGVLSGSRRDPRRLFTSQERHVGFARAGDRCEMSGWFGMRCHRRADHGDHWFPWSKGGATSMGNFVAACSKHNLAKSGSWPSWWQTTKIALRRTRYFPRGYTLRPGERY